jgi:hypothetical protein
LPFRTSLNDVEPGRSSRCGPAISTQQILFPALWEHL